MPSPATSSPDDRREDVPRPGESSPHPAEKPIYLQVREAVRTALDDGVYPVGSAIPSENELAQTYGTTRLTVRNAVDALVDEGLLRRVQGKGVFVAGDQVGTLVDDARGFRRGVTEHNAVPTVRVVSRQVRPAGPLHARVFDIDGDDHIYVLRRLNSVNGTPISLERVVIPLPLFPGIEDIDVAVFSLYEAYGFYGRRVERTVERVDVARTSVRDARLLGIEPQHAVLYTEALGYDQTGQPIEHTYTLRRSDLGSYTVHY